MNGVYFETPLCDFLWPCVKERQKAVRSIQLQSVLMCKTAYSEACLNVASLHKNVKDISNCAMCTVCLVAS